MDPNAFRWLFKLPELNKHLELFVANIFQELKGHKIDIVREFISTTFEVPFDLSLVDICFFLETIYGFMLVPFPC